MTILSNFLSSNHAKTNMPFIKPPIPQSSYFRDSKSLPSLSFSKLLSTAISSKPDTRVLAQSKPVIALLGRRLSYVSKLVTISAPSQPTAYFSPIEGEQINQVETLMSRVTKLNLPMRTSLDEISPVGPIVETAEIPSLSLFDRITTELDLQSILLPTPSFTSNITSKNNSSGQLPIQSSREEKLLRWILTSHNMYGLAVTVLHNFFDICCQKPEERNFINDSLVPRIRYTGFAFSATAGVVYHVAIGILFTPLVVATLGQKEKINEVWYGYWAGASISAMGMFAGMFGMISGNYLIHKTMERSIPSFKRLLTRYLSYVQNIYMQLNRMDFSQLRQEVENVETPTEMISIMRKLVGIAKNLLPTMVLQNRFSYLK